MPNQGHSPEKLFTARLWLRFAVLRLAVVLVGVMIAIWVLPYGLWWFAGALLLAIGASCSLCQNGFVRPHPRKAEITLSLCSFGQTFSLHERMTDCKYHQMCGLEATETSKDGTNFCILHSPDAEKRTTEFHNELKSYLQRTGNAPFPHFVFPKLPGTFKDWFGGERVGARANFSHATFLGDVDFSGFEFSEGAGFDETIFRGVVNFHGVRFVNRVDFSNAHFHKEANFLAATFHSGGCFDECRFDGLAYFGAKYGDRRFGFATQAAYFQGDASFYKTHFGKDAQFLSVCFDRHVTARVTFMQGKKKCDCVTATRLVA